MGIVVQYILSTYISEHVSIRAPIRRLAQYAHWRIVPAVDHKLDISSFSHNRQMPMMSGSSDTILSCVLSAYVYCPPLPHGQGPTVTFI